MKLSAKYDENYFLPSIYDVKLDMSYTYNKEIEKESTKLLKELVNNSAFCKFLEKKDKKLIAELTENQKKCYRKELLNLIKIAKDIF